MPTLTNVRHERFAQELAKGEPASRAYQTAGYRPDDGAASRLSGNIRVRQRVAELLEPSIQKTGLTIEGLLDKYRAIVFSDRSKILGWDGDPKTFPEELRPCISSVERGKDGRLRVRFCDKMQAMQALGRALGMFAEPHVQVTVRGDLTEEMARAAIRRRRAEHRALVSGKTGWVRIGFQRRPLHEPPLCRPTCRLVRSQREKWQQ